MPGNEKINIIVAETSPIISSGLVYCLRRLPGLQIQPFEILSYSDLIECIKTHDIQLVIVNPHFTGTFNPNKLRSETNADFKIAAIEVGVMDKQSRSLYNQTISIVEDINSIASKINALINIDNSTDDEKEMLSQREKEIVRLVVKGMTNKEIADTLFISVHTVITHRRNIARKLEIHSATGLTIYAIVNNLVDLSEIKL